MEYEGQKMDLCTVACVRRSLIDLADLQRELAGLEAGRQKRFLPKGSVETAIERQKKSERWAMTALQLLFLTDPAYAELRSRVQARLAKAGNRLAEMHLEAEEMIAESAERLEALEARAGELPDGTKVFRSANGALFTKDGLSLDPEKRGDVTWQEGVPNWEEYRAAKEEHDRIIAYRAGIESAQGQVDAHNDRLQNDQDAPTSAQELEDIDKGVTGMMRSLDESRKTIAQDSASDRALTSNFNATAPDLLDLPPPMDFAASSQINP